MNKEQLQELKSKIQEEINYYTKSKENSLVFIQQLFKQLENINQLEKIQNLPIKYLEAYLLLNQAKYSNYQTELFQYSQFNNIDSLIDKITFELEILEQKNIKNVLSELDRLIEVKKINYMKGFKNIRENKDNIHLNHAKY